MRPPDRARPAVLLAAFGIAALAAVAALYAFLRPPAVPPDALPAADRAEPRHAEIVIRQGHRVEGPDVIRLREGDTLTLRLVSDREAEAHLHGYDALIILRADVPAEHSLVASRAGRFELELHGGSSHAHEPLTVLEVAPRR